jgi:tetratricopeptide (TPR) repeat protein
MRRLIASAGLALGLAACGGGGLEPLPRRADAIAAPAVLATDAAAFTLDDPSRARARYESALARDPDRLAALNDLAVTWLAEGRPEAARQLLDEVLARGGAREQQAALVNLATIYAQDGYLAAALAHCETARDVDPSRAEPRYVLALLVERGDRPRALAEMRDALRLDDGTARGRLVFLSADARARLDALAAAAAERRAESR